MENVLVYLSIIHNGDWNKIYQDILEKRPLDKEDIKKTVKEIREWQTIKKRQALAEAFMIFLMTTIFPIPKRLRQSLSEFPR